MSKCDAEGALFRCIRLTVFSLVVEMQVHNKPVIATISKDFEAREDRKKHTQSAASMISTGLLAIDSGIGLLLFG